ncbi:MAG: glycosyltransferase family 39 protein [Methylophilaceae bacterium]|nr:glycosyltransferase family 39 protein [Methylophilaceae bacterium]
MNKLKGQSAAWIALWLVLVVIALFGRTYIPIDETRYVTVAWNMWLRQDYLVPWLNGAPYSHKPPLLFWLMNAGWAVFGVNDWWPRLVPSLFALGSLFLTAHLARRLWPENPNVSMLAPVILFGCMLWMVFTTATMFDMLIACFTLLGMLGVVTAWQGAPFKGWLLVGVAIGLGLLAKGPTILLQILPTALLAPWWGRDSTRPWKQWYTGILGAVLLGAFIALLWAIPAALRGGEEYRNAIFWGQTAERMVDSFAHKRPVWWYLPWLPLILFPWLLWPRAWRGLAHLRHVRDEFGVRFCLAWLVPVFVAFSLISGKQVHYLLPIMPAFSLLLARGLPEESRGIDDLPLVLVAILAGIVLMLLTHYAAPLGLPAWVERMDYWRSGLILAAGVMLLVWRSGSRVAEVWKVALYGVTVVCLVLYVVVFHGSELAYDVRPLAQRLKTLQDGGVPLAHVGEYHGQYQFLGRLRSELEVIDRSELAQWFEAHPQGRAIVYFSGALEEGIKPDYQQPYLGRIVAILGRESWPAPNSRVP